MWVVDQDKQSIIEPILILWSKSCITEMMKIQFKVDLKTVLHIDGESCVRPFWVLGSVTSPDQQLRGVLQEKTFSFTLLVN